MILVYPFIYIYICICMYVSLFIYLFIYLHYLFIYLFIYLFNYLIYILSLDIIHYQDDRQTAWRTKDAYINRMIEETAPAKSWKTTVGLGRENTLGCNAVPVSTPKFLVISCITCNHLPTFMNLHQNAQRGFHLCMLSDSINVNVHYPKALWLSGKYRLNHLQIGVWFGLVHWTTITLLGAQFFSTSIFSPEKIPMFNSGVNQHRSAKQHLPRRSDSFSWRIMNYTIIILLIRHNYINHISGWWFQPFSTPLKKSSQWEGLSHILWKTNAMFQKPTRYPSYPHPSHPSHPMPPTLSSNSIWFSLANFLSHRVLLPPTRPVPPTTSAQSPAARATLATRGGLRCRLRGGAEGAEGLWRAARQEPWLGAKCILGEILQAAMRFYKNPGCADVKGENNMEKSDVFAKKHDP